MSRVKKRAGYRSIHRRFLNFCVGFALGLVFTFVTAQGMLQVLALWSEQTLDTQEQFSAYWNELNELDELVYAFSQTPSEEFYLRGQELAVHLLKRSERMDQRMNAPRSRDLYILTRLLQKETEDLGGNRENQKTGEKAQIVQDRIAMLQNLYGGFFEELETYLGARRQQQVSVRVWGSVIMLIVDFTLAVFFLFQGRRLSANVVRPILMLTDQAREIIGGNEETRLNYVDVPGDEIAILNNAFCEMVETNREQMRRLKEQGELKLKLHRTRLRLLQSRVNPHFMFNILNIIAGLSVEEDASRTTKFTIKTASYFRYSLESLDKIVRLREEMENVRLYLEIQKERFGEKIQWEISLPEECENLKVPAMILQPLCENSIVHGMAPLLRPVRILVSARLVEGQICLSVFDDGAGIAPQEQDRMKCEMQEWRTYDDAGGIGIGNTFQRLQMFYHGRAEFQVESIPMERTVITFLLPVSGELSGEREPEG